MTGKETVINIIEKGTTDVLSIPWTPQKIKFKSGGQNFAEYDIMDLGTVQLPIGTGVRTIAWDDGILPSSAHSAMPWQNGEWQDPQNYQGMFSMWKCNKTILTIIVTGTPICMDVYLSDYDITYQDGFGDYHYYIEFSDSSGPSFTISSAEPSTSDGTERDTDPEVTTYTIKDNDTLWGIAQCYMGDGLKWEELYELNKDVIENAAKERGYSSSDNGWWIFPGTVLKIPGTSTSGSTDAGEALTLNNAPIYVSSDATSIAGRVTGTYYLYDGKEVLGRYRITNSSANVGKTPMGQYVTGWLPSEYV